MLDRLAILLTPPGAAAIAVIRVRAADLVATVQPAFSGRLRPGRAVHGALRDGEQILDDPVVVLHEDEQTADLSLHGGPWVVRSVLRWLERNGFDVIDQPGLPLPAAAVDADSEIEAEMLAHLPRARTELAMRVLLNQPAAWAPFDPTKADPTALRRMLADRSLRNLLRLPRVAIVGAPNVGKSTLANQLFAQERSITADLPGTTRDWVGETANIDGLAVMLADTPGQGQPRDAVEAAAIDASSHQIHAADLILLVLDPTQPLDPFQRQLIDRHPTALRVINKSDRSHAWTPDPDALRTVATRGDGVDHVRQAILTQFGCLDLDPAVARIWTDRQAALLHDALGHTFPGHLNPPSR